MESVAFSGKKQKRQRLFWVVGACMLTLLYMGCLIPDDTSYEISYTHLMYRNFANGIGSGFERIVGITDSGGPVEESDITGVSMTDAAGNEVIADAEAYYHITVMRYDCTSGTCSQSGPIDDSGILSTFSTLPQDTYDVEVEMQDGQVLTAGADYPGQVILP